MKKIEKINVSDNCVLVKIFDSDKIKKTTTEGGLITSNILKPLADICGIGMAVSVGKNLRWIKENDIVLYSWIAEDQPERFLGRDEDGEYRIIKEGLVKGQIYGIVKTNKKSGYSHIIPKKNYVLCEPENDDFEATKSIFQIPVKALNPQDNVASKMGINVGDWIICEPYSAKAISVNRKIFWFIFMEEIIGINKGMHKLATQRKYVSPILRMSSRKNLVELN